MHAISSSGLHSHTYEGQDVRLPQGAEPRSARRREEGDENYFVSRIRESWTLLSRQKPKRSRLRLDMRYLCETKAFFSVYLHIFWSQDGVFTALSSCFSTS